MDYNKDKQGMSNRTKYLLAAVLICSAILIGIAAPVKAAELSTDKADYAPWETVYISGAGFTPGATVAMTVEWPAPDGGTYEVLPSPIADDAGRIVVGYSLTSGPIGCGIEGAYSVVAVDSFNGQIATTSFTDAWVPYVPTNLPTGHWVIFSAPNLPTYLSFGATINSVHIWFRYMNAYKVTPGVPFTFRFDDVVNNGDTYILDTSNPTSPPSGFVPKVGSNKAGLGTYEYVTVNYQKASVSPPVPTINGAPTTSPEGTKIPLTGSATYQGSVALTWSVEKDGVAYGDSGTGASFTFEPDDDAQYKVTLTATATDNPSKVGTATAEIEVTNVAPTLTISGASEVNEGAPYALTLTDSDPGADSITSWWITWGDGSPVEEVSGLSSVTHEYADGPSNPIISATASDEDGTFSSNSIPVTVNNVAPEITSPLVVPVAPVQVGPTMIPFSLSFTDPGTADTHEAKWNWGDGLADLVPVETGAVSIGHAYATPGIYTVSVTVTDDDGGSDTETNTTSIVVFDPSAGFATGGGWINSPAGNYTADPSLTGKANFGFVSKYKKDATVPDCSVEFQFKPASLNFKSTACEWLVVAGSVATYRGTGTVNGAGSYGFLLSAKDDSPDTIRMKIWNAGGVIYDNQLGAGDAVIPTTSIGGGSIVIHT